MAKKKRGTNAEGSSLDNDATTSSVNKESSTIVQEPEPSVERIPVFKSLKFAQSKAALKKNRVWKPLKQLIAGERYMPRAVTYSSIDAPVSLKPAKKYSDISGLNAKYTDPQTKLRFSNAAEFQLIRTLQPETINAYLALRKASVV